MLRPPHSLLAALAATTVVVTAALGWAGWRLIDQQRAVDEQRTREQGDMVADAVASRIGRSLAEAGEWLSGWASNPASSAPVRDGAVALAIGPDGVRIAPAGGLPFVPPVVGPSRSRDEFAAIESAEFAAGRPAGVAERYRAVAASPDTELRAGALLRLGRVLRKTGDLSGALAVYQQLGALGAVRTDGLPAELAGLAGQHAVYQTSGDRDGERRVAAEISRGLDGGRWLVARGTAEFLRDEAGGPDRPDSWQLAEALSEVWGEAQGRLPARGLKVVGKDGRRVLVLWRSDREHAALLAAFADRFLAPLASASVAWQLADSSGRRIGGAEAAEGRPATRMIDGAESSWTLRVWPAAETSAGTRSRRTVLLMVVAPLAFVWVAAYFIGRAIRREAEVARLQSAFVAAVSHEFRSPLTAVRQMAEMLEMDRLPTEARRHAYYKTIAAEAIRLQRLVETLLNFGKMEAGAARYRFLSVDVAAVVRAVIGDVEAQARSASTRIETSGPDSGLLVLADEGALGAALRNLVDNAIKYSPGESTVRVEWARDSDRAAIRVVDNGPGIPRGEQRAIFEKFVRGRAAAEGSVQGTGVGLSMAREIVRAHGGEIQLASEIGRGSTFTLWLPLCTARPDTEAAGPLAGEAEALHPEERP